MSKCPSYANAHAGKPSVPGFGQQVPGQDGPSRENTSLMTWLTRFQIALTCPCAGRGS